MQPCRGELSFGISVPSLSLLDNMYRLRAISRMSSDTVHAEFTDYLTIWSRSDSIRPVVNLECAIS